MNQKLSRRQLNEIIKYNYTYLYRALEINFKNIWKLYYNFSHFKHTSIKIKKLNKQQLIQIILKHQDRLSYYFEEEDEEEEELL